MYEAQMPSHCISRPATHILVATEFFNAILVINCYLIYPSSSETFFFYKVRGEFNKSLP